MSVLFMVSESRWECVIFAMNYKKMYEIRFNDCHFSSLWHFKMNFKLKKTCLYISKMSCPYQYNFHYTPVTTIKSIFQIIVCFIFLLFFRIVPKKDNVHILIIYCFSKKHFKIYSKYLSSQIDPKFSEALTSAYKLFVIGKDSLPKSNDELL